jgi:uncharacterized protein YjbJ (UPF0337 family)
MGFLDRAKEMLGGATGKAKDVAGEAVDKAKDVAGAGEDKAEAATPDAATDAKPKDELGG